MLGHPRGLAREIERPVDLRRQQLLTQPDAPRLWTVVDETALHRPLSGPEVMKAQPEYLIEVSEPPNTALQITPFRISGLAVAEGPITAHRFPTRTCRTSSTWSR